MVNSHHTTRPRLFEKMYDEVAGTLKHKRDKFAKERRRTDKPKKV